MVTPSVAQQTCLHTAEFSLAVAACMWPPSEDRAARVNQCLDRQIDWSHFLRVVDRHRIAGLVNHALTQAENGRVPPEAKLALKARAETMAHQGLRAAVELSRLVGLLQKAGIPCVVLKGVPLAILAYQNIGLRHSRDNDLLVSPQDIMSADAVLLSSGYTRIRPASLNDEKNIQMYMRYRNQLEYIQEKTGHHAELHNRLHDTSAFGPQIDPRDAQQNWQSVELGGGLRVRTLSEDDLLACLCSHGARHAWFRLKWLADIGALLAKAPDSASRLLETSRSQGTERTAIQALLLCHSFWSTPLPSPMPVADWVARGLLSSAYSAMTVGDAAAEATDRRFGIVRIRLTSYFYLFGNKLGCLRRILLNELLLPTDIDRLPARIRFLYPLLRLPLFVTRYRGFRKAETRV